MSILSTIFDYETKNQRKLKMIEYKIQKLQGIIVMLDMPKDKEIEVLKLLSEIYCDTVFTRISI